MNSIDCDIYHISIKIHHMNVNFFLITLYCVMHCNEKVYYIPKGKITIGDFRSFIGFKKCRGQKSYFLRNSAC